MPALKLRNYWAKVAFLGIPHKDFEVQLTYKNKKIALKFSWSDSYAYYVFK